MTTIHFKPNEPQILSLKDPSGCLDDFNVLYETSDGKTLQLPRPAAVKLNLIEVEPGEEFSATKMQQGRQPAEWVFALTARSEKIRAEKEAETLAEKTRADLPGQLQASVLRQMPKSARSSQQAPAEQEKGTGTYGPVPQVAYAGRHTRETIPYNVAFVEILSFVTKALNESGEQWSEQSRQDLISTCLISSSKAGLLGVWER
jgi:hypothetical protein